jgi:hypothetical protein
MTIHESWRVVAPVHARKMLTKEENQLRIQKRRAERIATARTRDRSCYVLAIVVLVSGLLVALRFMIPHLRAQLSGYLCRSQWSRAPLPSLTDGTHNFSVAWPCALAEPHAGAAERVLTLLQAVAERPGFDGADRPKLPDCTASAGVGVPLDSGAALRYAEGRPSTVQSQTAQLLAACVALDVDFILTPPCIFPY